MNCHNSNEKLNTFPNYNPGFICLCFNLLNMLLFVDVVDTNYKMFSLNEMA